MERIGSAGLDVGRGTVPDWAERVSHIGAQLKGVRETEARQVLLGEAWKLLNGAIFSYISKNARRRGVRGHEEFQDIATAKALDLAQRLMAGNWVPVTWTSRRTRGYVRQVARNGLVDWLKNRCKYVDLKERGDSRSSDGDPLLRLPDEPAEDPVECQESAEVLAKCIRGLPPVARAIWILRMLYGLRSKDVGRHPRVNRTANYVDVTLFRSNRAIRACLGGEQSCPVDSVPIGTVSELWHLLRLPDLPSEYGDET